MLESGHFARHPLEAVNQLLVNQVELNKSLNKAIAEYNTLEAILLSMLRGAREGLLELAAKYGVMSEAEKKNQEQQEASELQQTCELGCKS